MTKDKVEKEAQKAKDKLEKEAKKAEKSRKSTRSLGLAIKIVCHNLFSCLFLYFL